MIAGTASRVAAVCDAIIAIGQGIAGVSVLDGPQAAATRNDLLIVGKSDDAVIVHYEKPNRDAYGTGLVEFVDVICSVESWSGSLGMKPRRDRCVAIFSALNDAINADPTLGGACDVASLAGTEAAWSFQNGDGGSACLVGFAITAKTNI